MTKNDNGLFDEFDNMFDSAIVDSSCDDASQNDKSSKTEEIEEVVSLDDSACGVSSSNEEVVSVGGDKSGDTPKRRFHLFIYDILSTIISAIIIIAVVFTFVFRLVSVDGQSMTNTLQHGDWLLTVNKTEYVQGDIVVIVQDTYFHEPLIKRVIAKGGQTVDINYETNTVYVDGKALEEPYVKESYILESSLYRQFPYTVPEGHLFCMGDNRNGSTDSRSELVGPIDERQILGKAVVRVMPFGDFDIYDYE